MKTHKSMWAYIAAITWTVTVIVGSSVPGNDANKFNPLLFEGGDKIAHLGAYLMMVLLWGIALKSRGKRIGGARLSFYMSIAIGIVLEICQSTIFESRSFEILDIIANIMGSIIGLILFYKFF